MRHYEKLNRIKEILPNNIRCCSECRKRMEIGLRHPNAEGSVFLSESLSGGNGRNTFHRLGRSRRIDEYVLVVSALTRRRQMISDQFTQTELQQADKEGAC